MKNNIFAGILLLLSLPVCAENIRGRVAGTLSDSPVSFSAEELVILEAGPVSEFQAGLEISLEIPRTLRNFQNSFALMLYRNVVPEPSGAGYTGSRTYMRLLPSRETVVIQIPFSANHGITGSAPGTMLPVPVSPDDFPLYLTIVPVIKGIPDYVSDEVLSVSASVLWRNEGTVSLSLANPSEIEGEIITAIVDGVKIPLNTEHKLSAGLHWARISSTHAAAVEQTFAVEPGEHAELALSLDYRPPEITVIVPPGTDGILLNGTPLTLQGEVSIMEITAGDHTITYILGGVEISSRFTVRPGMKVKIDLITEIDITEYGAVSGYGAGNGSPVSSDR